MPTTGSPSAPVFRHPADIIATAFDPTAFLIAIFLAVATTMTLGFGVFGREGGGSEGEPAPARDKFHGGVMPIRRELQTRAFGPEDIKIITAAFEDALGQLKLVDRSDPLAEIVAKKMIEIAEQGERDPLRLKDRTLQALRS
jgi:hypothetical protein